jgi:hypothetical protein
MDTIEFLTSKQKQWLAAMALAENSGEREHSKAKGAIFISADEMQKKLGDGYKSKISKIFDVVSDSYHHSDKKSKSYTMAYRIKKQVKAELADLVLEQSTPPKNGIENENYFVEQVNIAALDFLVEKGPLAFENIEHFISAKMYTMVYNRENGCNYVQYCRKTEKNTGRRFAQSPSLQSLPKVIRTVICKSTHAEIDMVNAHPTIFKALAASANISAPLTGRLVDNRDEVYSEISEFYLCSTLASKKYMLQTSYLCQLAYDVGSEKAFTEWCDKESDKLSPAWQELGFEPVAIPFAKNYQKEILAIIEKMSDHYFFAGCQGIKYRSRKASIMIQTVEDNLLQKMIDVLIDENVKIDALSFDGLCIRNPSTLTQSIIGKMEAAMNTWFKKIFKVDLNMRLSIKEYGE